MKTGFDQVRAVKAWLDEVTTLVIQRCDVEWRINTTTALYLWYEPSKPGKWGRFSVAPSGCKPGPSWKLATAERLSGYEGREPFWTQVRAILNRLDILDPDDMASAPPAAQLWNSAQFHGAEPTGSKPSDPEADLRKLWTDQGISKEQQDAMIADATAKAQPGAQVGPFKLQQPESVVVICEHTTKQAALEF